MGEFAGGHAYFVSQLSRRAGREPFSVHTTFQYGGAPGKRHRLREAMLWRDEVGYYDPPGGVLVFAPELPTELLRAVLPPHLPPGGAPSPAAHIALMRSQLRQIRAALAIAHALNAAQ